jgi:hypothetical protein
MKNVIIFWDVSLMQDLPSTTSQNTTFFIVTAVKTLNLTKHLVFDNDSTPGSNTNYIQLTAVGYE